MKVFYHNGDFCCPNPLDLNKKMIIYRLRNMINKKVYIGQTTNKLKSRLINYKRKNSNILLNRAFKKYGIHNFEVSIIEECKSIGELNNREEYWIIKYKSNDQKFGYNLQSGGNNHNCNEFTKQILSEKCSGWHHTPEAIEKIRMHSTGKNHPLYNTHPSKETLIKMAISHKGQIPWNKGKHYYLSETVKQNMSKAQKGRKITWGDKISKAKFKVDKEEVVEYLKLNPRAKLKDLQLYFNLKTHMAIFRLGGIKKLRKELFFLDNS